MGGNRKKLKYFCFSLTIHIQTRTTHSKPKLKTQNIYLFPILFSIQERNQFTGILAKN